MTGAQAIIKCLEEEHVSVIFGYPGAAICPFYDALPDSPIRHILVRQEQNAGHAAGGYARASHKTGVCVVTSGRRNKPDYRDCKRIYGFNPDCCNHRAGAQ